LVKDAGRSKYYSVVSVQTLQFLVRDWSYAYLYPYGAIGGQMLLERRLQVRPAVAFIPHALA